MLRIRLRRVGKKKQPSYRIVVADVRAPRDGAIVEQVGHYNPLTNPPTIVVNADKVKHWMGVGAKPSDTVIRILEREGILDRAPVPDTPSTKAKTAVAVAEPEAAAEEPAAEEPDAEEPEAAEEPLADEPEAAAEESEADEATETTEA